jgi:tRNA G18 (ribose-2'-O)-methylase SpoU
MPVDLIRDLQDPRVSEYAHVGHPEWLLAHGIFVAEGRLVVRRLLESDAFIIRSVLVTPTALSALEDVLNTTCCPIYVCEQETMNQIAGFNFHRGCLALAERPAEIDPSDRFHSARRLLALEGVGNPDNVGGLFRVAAAFGVDGVLLDRRSSDPLYRKAIRTSMGAVFRVRFARSDSWLDAITSIAGADIIALTPAASAINLGNYISRRSARRPIVLMVGAEGPGLSPHALAAATTAVRIPIADNVDSLNVVVAGGIALAALTMPSLVSASLSSEGTSRDRHLQ